MGKASRIKREKRQFSAAGYTASALGKSGNTDEPVVIINGYVYEGLEQIQNIYGSWVIEAFIADEADCLEDIEAMGQLMHSNILEVGIEVVDYMDGSKSIVNPLVGAFLLEKENCFNWFFERTQQTVQGMDLLARFTGEALQMSGIVDHNSFKGRAVRKLVRNFIEIVLKNGLEEAAQSVNQIALGSDMVAQEWAEAKGIKFANAERTAILEALSTDGEDMEINPEAIQMGEVAVSAAQDSSRAELAGSGWRRAL